MALTKPQIIQYQQDLAQRLVQITNEARNAYEWSQRALDGSNPVYTDTGQATQLSAADISALQSTYTEFGTASQVMRGTNTTPINVVYQLLPSTLPTRS